MRPALLVAPLAPLALMFVIAACSSDDGGELGSSSSGGSTSSGGASSSGAASSSSSGSSSGDQDGGSTSSGGAEDGGLDAGGVIGAGPYSIAYAARGLNKDVRGSVTATFTAAGELDSYRFNDNEAPTRNTNAVGEAYMDAWSALGRWNGGITGGTFYASPGHEFSATQGFHHALVVRAAVPATGDGTYVLAAATTPTFDDGSAVGTLTGSAHATLAALGSKIAFELTLTVPNDAVYTVSTTGGLAAPATAETNVFNQNLITTNPAGDIAVTSTGAACQGEQACKASIDGAFGGPSADRIGIVVVVRSGNAGKALRAAAVFSRE